jgi:hypothetical protein
MTIYRNLGRNSGVAAYEMGLDYIKVRFNEGGLYLYTVGSTGANGIHQMKLLAHQGRGLNSYISRVVRKRYARRIA